MFRWSIECGVGPIRCSACWHLFTEGHTQCPSCVSDVISAKRSRREPSPGDSSDRGSLKSLVEDASRSVNEEKSLELLSAAIAGGTKAKKKAQVSPSDCVRNALRGFVSAAHIWGEMAKKARSDDEDLRAQAVEFFQERASLGCTPWCNQQRLYPQYELVCDDHGVPLMEGTNWPTQDDLRNNLLNEANRGGDLLAYREVAFWMACDSLARELTWGYQGDGITPKPFCGLLGGPMNILRKQPAEYKAAPKRIFKDAFHQSLIDAGKSTEEISHDILESLEDGPLIPRRIRYPVLVPSMAADVKALRQTAVEGVKRARLGLLPEEAAAAAAGGPVPPSNPPPGSDPLGAFSSAGPSSAGRPAPPRRGSFRRGSGATDLSRKAGKGFSKGLAKGLDLSLRARRPPAAGSSG